MKCTDVEKLILLEDSGEMAQKRAGSLAAHLHDCESCRRFQHALIEAKEEFPTLAGPSETTLQNIKREARMQAPQGKRASAYHWKPALAMAASVLIAVGFFLSTFRPDSVGLELVVTNAQLLDTQEQVANVMYSGLSDDDLAFNFLMTYEGT